MRRLARVLLSALALLMPAMAAMAAAPGAPACAAGQPVREERYLTIGGIAQWVVLKGDDCRNPVLLVVHGGPGNPLSPYLDGLYAGWDKHFTLATWDQRGAGRSFTRNPVAPDTTEQLLSVGLLAADGVDFAAWTAQRLGKRRVILFGGSWGSALAVHMARLRPGLFGAYVGAGQMVSHAEGSMASYRKTLDLARAAGDAPTVAALAAIGAPPWTNPRAPGILRRATRIYEGKLAEPAPPDYFTRAPRYAGAADLADYERGEDFSWLQFVGIRGQGMQATLDLYRAGPDFPIPVFLLQGEHDLVTVPEVARRWFDGLKAPHKEFVLLPRTGHDQNPTMLRAQLALLREKAAPLVD